MRIQKRNERQKTREHLGCDKCEIDGYEEFELLPRVAEVIGLYSECCTAGLGRMVYPYDSAPCKNPVFVRQAFSIMDRALSGEIDDLYDEVILCPDK